MVADEVSEENFTVVEMMVEVVFFLIGVLLEEVGVTHLNGLVKGLVGVRLEKGRREFMVISAEHLMRWTCCRSTCSFSDAICCCFGKDKLF